MRAGVQRACNDRALRSGWNRRGSPAASGLPGRSVAWIAHESAHRRLGWLLPLAALLACGCQTVRTPEEKIARSNIPRELTKASLPDYVVEPPDLIRVEVFEALPGRPITGERLVRPDGKISLDFYGEVYVAGLTTDEIKEKVVIHLRKFIPDEILGLVEQDENGQVRHIPPVESDRVFVDVTSYNSKVYYVQGDVRQPGRLPITGNETVLDAINYAGGLLLDGGPAEHPPGPAGAAGGLLRAGPAGQLRGDRQRGGPDDQLPAPARRPPGRLPRPDRPDGLLRGSLGAVGPVDHATSPQLCPHHPFLEYDQRADLRPSPASLPPPDSSSTVAPRFLT